MTDNDSYFAESPVRLCCMTRHWGVECPDGTFMCCICFEKARVEEAHVQDDGTRIDVCSECAAKEFGVSHGQD